MGQTILNELMNAFSSAQSEPLLRAHEPTLYGHRKPGELVACCLSGNAAEGGQARCSTCGQEVGGSCAQGGMFVADSTGKLTAEKPAISAALAELYELRSMISSAIPVPMGNMLSRQQVSEKLTAHSLTMVTFLTRFTPSQALSLVERQIRSEEGAAARAQQASKLIEMADKIDDAVVLYPVVYVMNKAEDGYCMCFSAHSEPDPESAYSRWMAQQNQEWILANGYHPVRRLEMSRQDELLHEAATALREAAAALISEPGAGQ